MRRCYCYGASGGGDQTVHTTHSMVSGEYSFDAVYGVHLAIITQL